VYRKQTQPASSRLEIIVKYCIIVTTTTKVKLSLYQAMEAHRVVRR
jgi:hypothetical protein